MGARSGWELSFVKCTHVNLEDGKNKTHFSFSVGRNLEICSLKVSSQCYCTSVSFLSGSKFPTDTRTCDPTKKLTLKRENTNTTRSSSFIQKLGLAARSGAFSKYLPQQESPKVKAPRPPQTYRELVGPARVGPTPGSCPCT